MRARPYVQQVNLQQGAQRHLALAFAHIPLYGRDPRPLVPFDPKPHLAQFSEEAFVERVRVLIETAWNACSGTATGQS